MTSSDGSAGANEPSARQAREVMTLECPGPNGCDRELQAALQSNLDDLDRSVENVGQRSDRPADPEPAVVGKHSQPFENLLQ